MTVRCSGGGALGALMSCAVLVGTAVGGTGTMRQVGPNEWVLDFCVSMQFNATGAQLQKVREAFELGSPILYDATDGQVRFGRISIFNNSQGGPDADVWIHPGMGGAFATYGQYGDYEQHITLWYGSNIDSPDITSYPDRAAYTMAHEFAHHLWAVRDEYNGVACVESNPSCMPDMQNCCDCEAFPHSPTATYCLMDNYFTRGGNLNSNPSGTGTYTLNEFCIDANHDPDGDNFQTTSLGASCWTYIANHPDRGLSDPGVPMEASGSPPGPQFFDDVEEARFVLCMDTSGSMETQDLDDTASRLHRLKQAGHVFINLVNDGDRLGVVDYNTFADPVFPIQMINNANDRQTAKDIITDFDPDGSTAIGRGLIESRDMLTPLPDSCTQRIVLCSDGYGNVGPDELTVINSLVNNRIPTSCLAIGGSVSEDNLKKVAYDTGGTYTHVISGADIPQSYAFSYAEMSNISVFKTNEGDAPPDSFQTLNHGGEPSAPGTVFLLLWMNPNTEMRMSIVDPSGLPIDETLATNHPMMDYLTGLDSVMYKVHQGYPGGGGWTMVLENMGDEATDYQLLTFMESDGFQLAAGTDRRVYPCDEEIIVMATPQFRGIPVRGVDVTAVATLPNGQTLNMVLVDDGIEPDAVPSDGIYTAALSNVNEAGGVLFEISAEHAGTGTTFPGELGLFTDAPDTSDIVLPFSRVARTTAVVTCCRADVNGDGRVDFEDLNVVLGGWGMTVPPYTGGDTDGRGTVDFRDLNAVLQAWGKGIGVGD